MSLKGEASNLFFLFNCLADLMFDEEFLQKFIWTAEATDPGAELLDDDGS